MKKKKQEDTISQFEMYLESLTQGEKDCIADFFRDVSLHVKLPSHEQKQFCADFEKALIFYSQNGVSLHDALERLSMKNAGGFYARPPVLWYALDDAAKIYPLSMKQGQMALFRLSVYLKKPVIPEILQVALTFTIKRFPSFATTVKKGFFWHYLDTAKKRFAIEPDSGMPCRPLKIAYSGSQAFRVIYYNNRISVEFFHILTDGTGGMNFLKTLTAQYLRLLGVSCEPCEGVFDINEAPSAQETANEFCRADENISGSGFIDKSAVQMSGRLSAIKPFRVLHFKMCASELKSAAAAKGVTITAYILAQMFIAGHYATDELCGDISIQVPVNMRKYYSSQTLRNFSMYCGIRLPIESVTTADEILPEITRQLKEKSSKESMSLMMRSAENMVRTLRYIPLFIKTPVARIIYGFLGDGIFSNTLSNMGTVKFPLELCKYIDSLDFMLGTAFTNRAGCTILTYENTSVLSITKMTSDPSFEECLYDLLEKDGIAVTVEGSEAIEG